MASGTAIIPARLESSRFPRKVLADDTGLPLIVHVAQNAAGCPTIDRVVVATDSDEVVLAVTSHGFEAVLTDASHPNGSSRVAEAAALLSLPDHEIVVNVQGDEPELEHGLITAAIEAVAAGEIPMGTVGVPLDDSDAENPNVVKVCVRSDGRAMYFSRQAIPASRSGDPVRRWRHVGLYTYRSGFLPTISTLSPTPLESAEVLEQLRVLEHGYDIAVALCESEAPAGIDTPEQYSAFVARAMRED